MSPASLSLRDAAEQAGGELALVVDGSTLTFAQLAARVANVWSALQRHEVPLGPQARVAVQAHNSVETLLVLLALCESGTPFVPLHPRLTPPEAAVLIADAAPGAVLSGEAIAELARPPRTAEAAAAALLGFAALPPVDPTQPLA
ncbi:MAG TPA: AMP-binding protein, partial [Pseudomonadota bacterium]|nr:AMP-binding protein [Pseudomonadota bacterium]